MGMNGAWADVTVTLANGSSDPDNNGTRSSSTFTTNAASGLAGVVLTANANVDHYSQGTYVGRLALKTSAANTDEIWTITAPAGYGIKAYSLQATCAGNYTATITAGGTNYSISNDSYTTVSESGLNVQSVSLTVKDSATNWIAVGPFTVTVYPILEDTKLYRLKQEWRNNGTFNYYLYANTSDATNGDRLWKTSSVTNATLLTNSNYIWQAKSSSNNWLLYNIGGERYIAKSASASTSGSACTPLSATTTDDAEPLSLVNLSATVAGCVNLKATTQTNIYLDSYGTGSPHTNYVGWHTSTTHSGSFFKFIPVKTVTFSPAVAVNGGNAVSTIYVAADGSDSFTLPTGYTYTINSTDYSNTDAATAIAAAGNSDITVTVAPANGMALNVSAGTFDHGGNEGGYAQWASNRNPAISIISNNTDNTSMLAAIKNGNTSGFSLFSNNIPTFNISVPDGYVINSYTIVGTATSGDVTFTPTGGTATVFPQGVNATACVTGLNSDAASFQLSGGSGIYLDNVAVYVEYTVNAAGTALNASEGTFSHGFASMMPCS